MDRDELEWVAATVLPNIELNESIEGELVALASKDDPRVKSLCNVQPLLQKFLGRFTDAFGERVRPTLLIVRRNAPKGIFSVEALASFRDAVALSVVCYNCALKLQHPYGHCITFSNAFWFYPWMMDRSGENLIAKTPSMLGIHQIDDFKGQPSPEIPRHTLSGSDLDEPLLHALLCRWQKRYAAPMPDSRDRALFRSLNMANQAALTPAGSDITFYDVGRSIALWVSAFEILAHPGTGRSDLLTVYRLLDSVKWREKHCRERRYKAYERNRTPQSRRTLACRLYGEIYKARNAFLHGNPVTPRLLLARNTKRSLFQYAAPLYRMALTGFLPLVRSGPIPSSDDAEAFGAYIAEFICFKKYQETIERGLLTARGRGARSPE
jgi:hypothetical protein